MIAMDGDWYDAPCEAWFRFVCRATRPVGHTTPTMNCSTPTGPAQLSNWAVNAPLVELARKASADGPALLRELALIQWLTCGTLVPFVLLSWVGGKWSRELHGRMGAGFQTMRQPLVQQGPGTEMQAAP